MLKWTRTGRLQGGTVYTFTWAITGKMPWYWQPDVYNASVRLYRWVRDNVSTRAVVPDGYPRYSKNQDITLFQVRVPVYEPLLMHVEEVTMAGTDIIRFFHFMIPANHFMPPSGKLGGRILELPGAFYAPMGTIESETDPTGLPGPKSQFEKAWDFFGFEEVLSPAKQVLTFGLAGLAGYALYRAYRMIPK